MIEYQYAFNNAGKITDINKVTVEYRKSNEFYCVGCGAEMNAVLGEKTQHHFRHKNRCNCNPETYYHKLSKLILKYRFDSSSQFLVKYYAHNNCPKATQCELKEHHNWEGCSSVVLKSFNLKEYYNTCKEEIVYKGFKADLILTHSDYPNREPLFLEVSVTHNCTPEKINSKIRIIEIKVHNEDDAYGEIIENEGEFINESNIIKSKENDFSPIRFYNFKRKSNDKGSNLLSRFYLYNNKHGICQALCKSNVIECSEFTSEHSINSLLEVTISEDTIPKGFEFDLYDLGMALASDKGLDVKSCIFCNNFNRSHSFARRFKWASQCVENTNSQLPKYQKFHLAWGCKLYRCDNNRRKYILDSFHSIPYDVWINEEK